ncbi:D-alanine--D-alanine ligase [uncultured Paenalcaligenes sp.]|uniref:D-alanine--D-alanine ligase n=1 Tax=uncultured Paenalcaligenes sp. TaxID=1588925 RepID=UPI00263197EE|nr:D-alanine--D-alanine ligase [uncultured Paenalcaligenes sp.]
MTDLGKVGVLYGGISAEREVSLMSGAGVHQALCQLGVDAHLFDTQSQSLAELAQAGFDRVFIALHGRYGEDGTLQGALELLHIPYTGSGPMASAVAMDKVMTKRIWLQHGLPTPDFAVLKTTQDLVGLADRLPMPFIMKPAHEGSTVGFSRIDQIDQIEPAYALAAKFDRAVLAERFIQGRELTVPVIGSGEQARSLPIIEIAAPDGNYDFENKYYTNDTQYFCPAPLDNALSETIREYARLAYLAVGCEGWGRVDFMLDADNQPWLLEVNTSPGMTSHSLVPMAAKAEGTSYEQLCLQLIQTADLKLQAVARL